MLATRNFGDWHTVVGEALYLVVEAPELIAEGNDGLLQQLNYHGDSYSLLPISRSSSQKA